MNAVSAIDSNAKNTSAATTDDRNVLAQEPNADATVTTTAHDTGTAETDSPSEPAEIQPVQQASPEPSAKDKPQENVVSATDNDAENTSSATTALRVTTHRKHPSPTQPGHSTPPQRNLKNHSRSPWAALTTGAHLRKTSMLMLRECHCSQHRQRGDKDTF